jgi:hypothetical protein
MLSALARFLETELKLQAVSLVFDHDGKPSFNAAEWSVTPGVSEVAVTKILPL